jgi:hypothetical protein
MLLTGIRRLQKKSGIHQKTTGEAGQKMEFYHMESQTIHKTLD